MGGLIYGVRLRSESSYRYIGLTTKSAQVRLRQHWKIAAAGRKTPSYDWLRKQNRDHVAVDQLDWADGLEELGEAEIAWIALLRREGQPLLNLSDGGLGPKGVEWTAAMREAVRIRSTGRKIPSRFGEENPFYRRTHSAEQRAKWSAARTGSNLGADNPNYGKFGPDHPSFGHVLSEQARAQLSEKMRGAGNPNLGDVRAKKRARRCHQFEKGAQCPRVDAMLIRAITQTRASRKTRANTAVTSGCCSGVKAPMAELCKRLKPKKSPAARTLPLNVCGH